MGKYSALRFCIVLPFSWANTATLELNISSYCPHCSAINFAANLSLLLYNIIYNNYYYTGFSVYRNLILRFWHYHVLYSCFTTLWSLSPGNPLRSDLPHPTKHHSRVYFSSRRHTLLRGYYYCPHADTSLHCPSSHSLYRRSVYGRCGAHSLCVGGVHCRSVVADASHVGTLPTQCEYITVDRDIFTGKIFCL